VGLPELLEDGFQRDAGDARSSNRSLTPWQSRGRPE
jgi:hypothetical protein